MDHPALGTLEGREEDTGDSDDISGDALSAEFSSCGGVERSGDFANGYLVGCFG